MKTGHFSVHKLLSIVIIGLMTGFCMRQQVARLIAYDPYEYCEYMGIYFRDGGKVFDYIARDKYPLLGFDYASVCNINTLHVDRLASHFPDVTFYGVTFGNVEYIPAEIASLRSLKQFQLHDQRIRSVPKEIGDLTNLEVLKLGGNALSELPEEIGKLTHLKVLHAYDNKLTSLPSTTSHLSSLEILDLRTNKLTGLPKEIKRLSPTLQKLYLGGNPISKEEKENIKKALPKTNIYF